MAGGGGRAGLALIPSLATRRPIKKWAAAAALFGATFYLQLSGSEVATQRSYIMIGIVLLGVMIDRAAITFRTLTVAAIGVLLLAPQAVVHPNFQMSFAATLALVVGHQFVMPWKADVDTPLAARVALWGGKEAVGLLLASLVAGLATTPYAAYHFHRIAPYGVIANLLAMPVVSAVVMPMGILGALTTPFGFDAIFWQMMGAGIDWMIVVVLWVASLPGSVGYMPAFGAGPLLLVTLGMLLLCLLSTPLRWSGAMVTLAACLWALATPRPDVLVAADGQTAAIRGGPTGGWCSCTTRATASRTKNGWRPTAMRLVAYALAAEAFQEDCARAVAVASPQTAPGACGALLINRPAWRAQGATALFINGNRFAREVARPSTDDRPWARTEQIRVDSTPTIRRPAVPDATPPAEAVEADD